MDSEIMIELQRKKEWKLTEIDPSEKQEQIL